MGRIIHKTTEMLGDITISTNVYSSAAGDYVSITQNVYDRNSLAHKNNVMLPISDIALILAKASGVANERRE